MGDLRRRCAHALFGALLAVAACGGGDGGFTPPPDARARADASVDAPPPPDASGPDATTPDASGPDAARPDALARVCGDGVHAPGELCLGSPLVVDGGDLVYSARLIDVDGDGARDLVYLTSSHVVIRRGDGEGGFAAPADGPATTSWWLEAGDLDGDGVTDLVAAGRDAMTVWLGSGGGVFAAPITTPLGEPTTGLAVADVDGYAGDDILLGTNSILQVYQLAGPSSLRLLDQVAVDVRALAARDHDGDFRADAIVTYESGVLVYPGEVGGLGSYVDVEGGALAMAAVGDVDGDGALDRVMAEPDPAGILVRLRGAHSDVVTPIAVAGGPQVLDAGDLDRDGAADVVAGFPGAGAVIVLRADGAGALAAGDPIPLGDRMTSIRVDGDVNGDGAPDVAITLLRKIVVLETAPY